jgi:hypothetical protein
MAKDNLHNALRSVDWKKNVEDFLSEEGAVAQLDTACLRMAIWARQLENVEASNPAITFVRAMQVASHHAVATMSLGVYKAAAGSIRGIVENALYFTYFRSHPVELASLVREDSYYVSKGDIIGFHKTHTPGFKDLQDRLGLMSRIDNWYSKISAIVHGQVPGTWVEQAGISQTKFNRKTAISAVEKFLEAERIVHELFLITVGAENWDGFSAAAKRELMKGMPGDIKSALKLDVR